MRTYSWILFWPEWEKPSLDLTQAWGLGHVMTRHGCCEWEAESSEGQGRGRSKQFVIVAIVKVFVIAVG